MNHPTLSAKIRALVAAFVVTCALILPGCSATNVNGGAEQSFSDEELENHDGSHFFPDDFTFEELMAKFECEPGIMTDAGFGPGAYIVGQDGAPTPGTYHLSGSLEETGTIALYTPIDEPGMYHGKTGISYLGFTLLALEEGEAVFFMPPADTDVMSVESPEPSGVQEPYESGLYRVGTDIPAGTYEITQSPEAAAVLANEVFLTPRAHVYRDLFFGTDDALTTVELPAWEEGAATAEITAADGQFLELYGCTATLLTSPEEA